MVVFWGASWLRLLANQKEFVEVTERVLPSWERPRLAPVRAAAAGRAEYPK